VARLGSLLGAVEDGASRGAATFGVVEWWTAVLGAVERWTTALGAVARWTAALGAVAAGAGREALSAVDRRAVVLGGAGQWRSVVRWARSRTTVV
jgi:hypothetical protein